MRRSSDPSDPTTVPSVPGPAVEPDRVSAGEPVIVYGMGPALTGLLEPLTLGRGGRFVRDHDRGLLYLPGGREPLLHVGSDRGVPHHARPGYALRGAPPPLPRFLTPSALPDGPLSFRHDVWPLAAKELAFAYYHELFTAHPRRVRGDWAEFEAALAAEEWGGRSVRALVRKSVPAVADRLDLGRIDRPLHGIRFGGPAGLRRWMDGYLAAVLDRRADPAHSADLALIHGLRAVRAVLAGLPADRLAPDPWFCGFAAFLAEGPPAPRLEELRALARAGVVAFLGAGVRVVPDECAGGWRATGPTVPGAVHAPTLIEARTPAPEPDRTAAPLPRRAGAPAAERTAAGTRLRVVA
ncbi:hypothetical protein GCM10010466_57350 [Planomonospora alba]|uniref:Uncharacterized protein n=1 Tax=Planomonospora alba TaxID=161354 RepID=A0ABP6NW39_9ACTN